MEELPQHWGDHIIIPVYIKGDKTNRSITVTIYIQNFIHCFSLKVNSIFRWNYWESSVL